MGLTKRLLDLNIRPKRQYDKIIRDANKIYTGIDKITAKALERFGAIIRQDARKLIGNPIKRQRRTKRVRINGIQTSIFSPPKPPRSPGKSPMARDGDRNAGIRKILYIVDPKNRDVKIGFGDVGFRMGTKWGAELHEFGGSFVARVREVPTLITAKMIQKKKMKRGGKRKVTVFRELAKDNRGMYYGLVSDKSAQPRSFKMPKRPTMRTALNRHKKRMSQIWVDYYKARFG